MGGTVFLVSHDLQAIASVCSRGIMLSKGLVIIDGSPKPVIDSYQNDMYSDEDELKSNIAPLFVDENASNVQSIDKSVALTRVVLCNENGEEREAFLSGETISIILNYKMFEYSSQTQS